MDTICLVKRSLVKTRKFIMSIVLISQQSYDLILND